mgnify:CR=1 FL=1
MSTSVPLEVKSAMHSNPVLSGFYANGTNAVLFFYFFTCFTQPTRIYKLIKPKIKTENLAI